MAALDWSVVLEMIGGAGYNLRIGDHLTLRVFMEGGMSPILLISCHLSLGGGLGVSF